MSSHNKLNHKLATNVLAQQTRSSRNIGKQRAGEEVEGKKK